MNTNYIFALIGAIILLFASCEREDNALNINTDTIIGEWQVAAYIEDEAVSDAFRLDIAMHSVAKTDSITISELDQESVFWDFAVNAAFAVRNNTFETKLSLCQVSEDEIIGVNISNGKLVTSDSLYFEIKFEDDEIPFGTTYKIKGRRLDR